MPAEFMSELCRPFYRLEHSRTTPGNGLGLSLAAAIVQLHGGTIAFADNQPGLRVIVTLAAREDTTEMHRHMTHAF